MQSSSLQTVELIFERNKARNGKLEPRAIDYQLSSYYDRSFDDEDCIKNRYDGNLKVNSMDFVEKLPKNQISSNDNTNLKFKLSNKLKLNSV